MSIPGAFPRLEKMQQKRPCVCLFSGSGKLCAGGTVSPAHPTSSPLTPVTTGAAWTGKFIAPEARPWRLTVWTFPQKTKHMGQNQGLHPLTSPAPLHCLPDGQGHCQRDGWSNHPGIRPALCRLMPSAHVLAVGWQNLSFPVCLKLLGFLLTTGPSSAS